MAIHVAFTASDENSEVSAAIVGLETIEQVQQWLNEGGGGEVAVSFMSYPETGNSSDAVKAIVALVAVNDEQRNSISQELEAMFTLAFKRGRECEHSRMLQVGTGVPSGDICMM